MSEMTATRIAKGATVAAAAGLWIVAASFLWRTSVPSALHAPHVDPDSLAAARAVARAERFDRFLTWDTVIGSLVTLVVLAVVAWQAPRLVRAFPVGRIGGGVLVGLAAVTLVWAAGLPFDLAATWWQRRYGLSTQSYGDWAATAWGALGGIALDLTIVIAVLMALALALPRTWWLPAAALAALASAGLLLVVPYLLLLGTHDVRDARLAADIRALERREGVGGTPVRVENVSGTTNAINAYTIGIGPSERVVLWDTLFTNLRPRSVLFVTAHELGHVRSRHILKGLAWGALVLVPELLLVWIVTRRRGGLGQPAAVPLALLTFSFVGIAIAPFENAVSRRYEAEADWRALQATHDPRSADRVFRSFITQDLEPPSASTFEYLWFENHPTVQQRVAMARAWAARYGATARPFPASP
jgi:Zn-dependent protease with chaperone function